MPQCSFGRIIAARRDMFPAALVSASAVKPHDWHANVSRVGRFFLLTLPHAGHIRLVFLASTSFTCTPTSLHL